MSEMLGNKKVKCQVVKKSAAHYQLTYHLLWMGRQSRDNFALAVAELLNLGMITVSSGVRNSGIIYYEYVTWVCPELPVQYGDNKK